MATYLPPKRGVELIFYVGLVSQADTKTLQANPTLAAGDVKVSKDGGALANLTTLPAVTPASGKAVKVTLSATEMEADNLTVVFADASGAEWCDQLVHIATAARQVDDLTYPTVSGRSLDVSAGGSAEADVAAINGSTAAATRLALSAGVIIPGTVHSGAFTPTTTEFEADDITEATADHYNGRVIIFTSDSLLGQATSISDYSLSGGIGHFTVVALTEAPANDTTFIII